MSEIERATRGEVIDVGLSETEPRHQYTGSGRRYADHRRPDADRQFTWVGVEWQGLETEPATIPSAPHVRMGWSLVIATAANLLLGFTAIATGATLIGVVACTTLSIATCLLVLAELIGRAGR